MIAGLIERAADIHDVPASVVEYTIYAGNRIERGCVTVLLSAYGEPLSVCRIARQEDGAIVDEHATLETVAGLVAGTERLERTVETPCRMETVADRPVLFKRFMEGTLASVLLEPGERLLETNESLARRILLSSTRWLVAFYRTTREYHDGRRAAKREKVEALGCDTHTDHAAAFVGNEALTLAPTHGDFSTHNVLIGDGPLPNIIDFEHFSVDGVPLLDFFCLLVFIGRGIYGETPTSIRKVFFETGVLAEIVSECVSLYCDSLGIQVEELLEVLALCAEIRLERRRRLGFFADTEPLDVMLRDRLVADAGSVVW